MDVDQIESVGKELCKYFIKNGFCTLGDSCGLLHDRQQFRKQQVKQLDEKEEKKMEEDSINESEMTEICFSFDTTGSMYKWLKEVKTKLEEIVNSLFKKISNLRVSFIAHGDYCDADRTYVIKHIPFSTDTKKLIKWVQDAGQTGGGDWPECYEYVLYKAARFKWSRYAKNKALVVIGDATPHYVDYPENTLNIDWREELDRICMKSIKIYSIHCGGDSKSKFFYDTMARRSGGRYLTLANMKNICDIFIALCLRSSDQDKFEEFSNQLIRTKNADTELENALKELQTKESNASAVKRLMKDLNEIKRECLSNISVVPDNYNVFKWHVNIQPLQGALQSVYIHLILEFPGEYPARPPNITLHSYFMNDIHPNIMDNGICMDVLRSNIGIDGSSGSKYGGWTAAYSITSLLVNIASLFSDIITREQIKENIKREKKNRRDDDIVMDDRNKNKKRKSKRSRWSEQKYLTQKEMDKLIKRIRETECECGHAHHTPYPPLLSHIAPIDIIYDEYDCNKNYIKMVGLIISGTIIQTKIEDEYWKIKSLFPIEIHHQCVVWQFLLDWFDINSIDAPNSDFIMGFTDKNGNFFGINCYGYKIYKNKMDDSVKVFDKRLKQNSTISFILYLTKSENESNRVLIAINNEYVSNIILPNEYNNINKFYPTMFLKNIRIKLLFQQNNELNALPSKYNLPIKQIKFISQLPEIAGFTRINDSKNNRIFYKTQNDWNILLEKSLSYDVLLIIYSCLLYEDISRCKQINIHWYNTIDQYLVLERISTNCYFTGDSYTDDILGVGLYVIHQDNHSNTTNVNDNDNDDDDDTNFSSFFSAKSSMAQCTSTWISTAKTEMDLLSLTAWNEYKVRQGAWGEPLTHFLPLIINQKHSKKCKEELLNRLTILCKAKSFTEEIALIALSTLMNQFVVQLMGDVDIDNDKIDIKHASEKALIGYCAFHHLLLYLCNEYPLMRLIAYKKVSDFIGNSNKREKSHTPDLGKFLVNLAIIDDELFQKTIVWEKNIGKLFIDESLDRSVKWYLQKYPNLENMDESINCDEQRLKMVFKATQTGRRLILFQYWFIHNIARPKNKTLIQILNEYNKKWGKPTDKQKKRLMNVVKDILNNKTNYENYNWINYFNDLNLGYNKCFQSNEEIVKILKENIIRSTIKGYHRKNKTLCISSKYKDIARNIHEIELKKRTQQTDNPDIGPLSRLKEIMNKGKSVMLIMRMTDNQCKRVVGKIKMYDRHWNMILLNAKEYWKLQICYSKNNQIFVDKDRSLGKFVFVRGDDIVAIRIPDESLLHENDKKEESKIDETKEEMDDGNEDEDDDEDLIDID